jgi:hypothetical protein
VPLQVELFPAFFRRFAPGRDAELVLVEGESSCFYHPAKKAVVPCDACGRFLCALCDCELRGQHFCPNCLEVGKQKGHIQNLENQRLLYGQIAFALTVIPMAVIFGIYFTFITAPLALFVAIRYWKAPPSLVRRGRIYYVLAIILALLQLAGWVIFGYLLFSGKINA